MKEGSTSIDLDDVLFGDVWVCSGQSNMAFLLENAFNGSALVADADNHPNIRLFTSKKTSSKIPLIEQPVRLISEPARVQCTRSLTHTHSHTHPLAHRETHRLRQRPSASVVRPSPTGTPMHSHSRSLQVVEEPWNVSSRATVSDDGCPKCNSTASGRWGSGLGDDNWLYMSAVCYLCAVPLCLHNVPLVCYLRLVPLCLHPVALVVRVCCVLTDTPPQVKRSCVLTL